MPDLVDGNIVVCYICYGFDYICYVDCFISIADWFLVTS